MSPWRWVELKPEIPPKPQASAGWQLPATSSASQPGFGQVPSSSEHKWSIFGFIFFNNHCWVLPVQLLDGDPHADSAVGTHQGWIEPNFFCQGKQGSDFAPHEVSEQGILRLFSRRCHPEAVQLSCPHWTHGKGRDGGIQEQLCSFILGTGLGSQRE